MDVEGLDTFSAYDAAPALDDGEPLGLGMSLDEAIAERSAAKKPAPRPKQQGKQGAASARVFVGNMKYETTWQQLKDHFGAAGNVVHARVMENRTGRSQGCGVVEFSSVQDAQNAIATLHDSELDGRKLLVREDREDGQKPQPTQQKKKRDRGSDDVVVVGKKLYVGNLNYQTTWQQLKDHFKDCGKVVRADVNRGYGTVEFEKAADAAAAISRKSNTELDGRKINVREDREASKPSQARKRAKSNEGGVTRVGKRVYVGNLKFTTSWQTLKDHFKPVGDVVHAKLIARGCGIVEFETPEDARRAILELNDSELEGRPLQVREDREDRDLK